MCGIVGYIGRRQAPAICLAGLRRLEYRGYDSAGIAVVTDQGELDVRKVVGKLDIMQATLEQNPLLGTLGIGHTRWATHGKPSVENSHPHLSTNGRIAVVHNGIIENYQELRAQLESEGFVFKSQTDTEVMAHLVQKYYDGDLREAARKAVLDLQGAFAFGIICADSPDEMIAVRRFSPLVVGIGEGENYIASDMGAIRAETDKVYVIGDDELCRITRDAIEITDLELNPIDREVYEIPWPADAAEKGGHKKFMHKEIHEQPNAIRACLAGRLSSADKPITFENIGLTVDEIKNLKKVVFTACGTAYHAGVVGRFLMDKLARIPAEADLAAELQQRDPVVLDDTLCIVVSQSGETADTLEGLRAMKRKGAKVIGVINVVDSSIARESDGVAYIQAGPEIGVASTKAYTLQILTIELLALYFAEVRGTASPEEIREIKEWLLKLPEQAEELLKREDDIIELAKKHYEKPNALYLARGINLPSAMEGALKLKEISYIHAEAYSAGEMKHGPIALVCPDMFVVAIACEGPTYDEMIGNIMEIKARSGPLIAVTYDGDTKIAQTGVDPDADPSDVASQPNDMIYVPKTHEYVSPITIAIPLQLLAYHMADLRGEHIDQPRNLAKTVTVK
ncbi:MAG: glutamine--fructose-6-phosphate transaminase (isomerizing) [Armatimonadetes bacterium]|nr:glutamine--fructose-6-phosphate transaminase (isomerizing) [Armatimonadota bacterium]